MNIEEIKKRLAYLPRELKDGGFSDNSLTFCARLDIEYLLSIIEQCLEYEKQANCNWCGGGIKNIVFPDLQAIRKGNDCIHDYALIPPNEIITSQYRVCKKCHDIKWGD